ncbi:MAG: hypothetical protein NXI16_18005 [Alphaproteobacteria bacterium]|nr:hypothetical protein [Alphaproteobacteria bacterium]
MTDPADKADRAPDNGTPGRAAPPNAGGRYQAEPGQATGIQAPGIQAAGIEETDIEETGGRATPIRPLVDLDQEETREMPATGLRYSWTHAAAVVAAILMMVAFFTLIGE